MNRIGANFTNNSKYNSLPITSQLYSIKTDIAKLKRMPRAVQSRLMKSYKELEMNTKLDTLKMRRNNNPNILDLNKLRENLFELGEIFKEYRLKKTSEKGEWNTTNNKKRLIDQIFKKIIRTLGNINKQLQAEKRRIESNTKARVFNSQFPEEPYNKNLKGKEYQLRLSKLPNFPGTTHSYGGSLFVNVKGVGKRKVRYYKNGNRYVLVKGKKKKI